MENWSTEAVVVLRPVVIQKKEYTNVRHDREEGKEVKHVLRRQEEKGEEGRSHERRLYLASGQLIFIDMSEHRYILFFCGKQSCEILPEALLLYFLLYVQNCLQGDLPVNLNLVRALTARSAHTTTSPPSYVNRSGTQSKCHRKVNNQKLGGKLR